jgi:hypothetical protein
MGYPVCPEEPAWVEREDWVAISVGDVACLGLEKELIVY